MQKLGGWERLSIVVFVSWLIFVVALYFFALNNTSTAYDIFPKFVFDYGFRWIPVLDVNGKPDINKFGDSVVTIAFSSAGFAAFLVGPPILAYGFFLVVCWVGAGFGHRNS